MTITETLLAGVVVALISSIITRLFSVKNISNTTCAERRASCVALVLEKIEAIHARLDTYEEFKRRKDVR